MWAPTQTRRTIELNGVRRSGKRTPPTNGTNAEEEEVKRSSKPIVNWNLFTSLAGLWAVAGNINELCDWLVQHLQDSAKEAEDLRATKRRLSHETFEMTCQRRAVKAAGNYQIKSEFAKRCREAKMRREEQQ
ncbi:hypothetical protein ANCDUO_22867 [Ancylostoma duodenale]|uniref:Uncharacterized protein n=1 Tax=Ancylostoma duodenale TaxID=51022 RepID=A0A0C2CB38_9BILA|nr:hypothetical protein ANCDUO_22867 [Ancylostoma duodenale]